MKFLLTTSGLFLATAAATNAHSAGNKGCPEGDLAQVSTADVQGLLVEWELDHALGAEFQAQRVNGFALKHLNSDTVDPAAYPNAQPFHWAVLWERLGGCGIGPLAGKLGTTTSSQQQQQQQQQQQEYLANGEDHVGGAAAHHRRLLSKNGGWSGVNIARNQSMISLGLEADIVLRRLEEKVLAIENDLYFCDGNGIKFCAGDGGGTTPSITSDADGNIVVDGGLRFGSGAEAVEAPQLSCSFANDINDCSDPDSAVKMGHCCDGGGWKMVYQLDLADDANWDTPADLNYTVDNSGTVPRGSFKKVAYHLQLDDEWVFTSMAAFTDDATRIGIPVDWVHDHDFVPKLNVLSNSPALEGYSGMTSAEGRVEMWSNCYRTGESDTIGTLDHRQRRGRALSAFATDFIPSPYDHDDTQSAVDCYGSFQVHAQDGQTLFAYNGWSYSSPSGTVPYDDVGIGTFNGSNVLRNGWGTDWTFAANAPQYAVKRLSVFVSEYPGSFVPRDYALTQAVAQAAGQASGDDCVDVCGTEALCAPGSVLATCLPFSEGQMCDSYTRMEAFSSGYKVTGVDVNQAGHVFVVDWTNDRVLRHVPLSLIDRVAPIGESGWQVLADGLKNIWGLALCPNGNLYWTERNDKVINMLSCADSTTPSNGVCYTYADDFEMFYDIGNDGFNGMPYHIACAADNDLAVSTVSSGGTGGYVHHYNAQTDQWVLLQADGILRHSVGVSFTPEADLRVISQHESDDLDSDGVIDYRLQLIECTTLEPSSTLRGPACASYANTTEDFQDADSDGFISVSYHEDSTLVADYQWGNAITTADGRVLLARGGISADNADRGIFELQEDGSLEKLEHSGAIALKHPWDIAVSPTGDIFLSDYQSTSLYRLVCDNPGPLLACEEDEGEHGLPYPECNRHFECESGYGGEYCDQGKFNCDSDFCGSAELCAAELYECNWWTNGRYCSEYLELAEFEDNTYTDAPVGIAVNEINEIISVQGSAIRRYSPVAAAWSDIVEDGGTKLWGLTVCPNGNIYYNSRATQKTVYEIACADDTTPTNGVCTTYETTATEFYVMDASNANGTANPYHITCGSDNDLMVSTVTYGSLFHYDRQTDTWTDHASEVKHCVGVGFSPSADAYSLCYHSDNADSTENYQLLKLPCDTLDDRGHGEAPGCSKYADNFEAVKTMGGDYGWGDLAITNDGHILFARNDGDSTGTIWELDIVTDSFAPLEYGAANGDLSHPWGLAVGPTGTVYISDYVDDIIYTIECGTIETGTMEAFINELRADIKALQA